MKKVIKINKEPRKTMVRQLESFKGKFGREPGPDDPVSFDFDHDAPTPLTEGKVKRELVEAARKAVKDGKVVQNYQFLFLTSLLFCGPFGRHIFNCEFFVP